MSSWNESIKIMVTGEDGTDHELEIETDSEKAVYLYFNSGDDKSKREFLGNLTLETLVDVAERIKAIWGEEAKAEDK